ncbi:MAG: protein rep, partial [Armatimonadia bacterium]
MNAAGLPSARLTRFAACGSQTWIEAQRLSPIRPAPGQPDPFSAARLRCNCCRDRFCTPCAATRARVLARSLIALLAGHTARFITLTLRSTDEPLSDQIDHLYASYRSLRKTRLWTANVTAAAAMLEITRNKATGRWHPHLHVLAEGRFIPHADLRKAWTTASNGSFICDIRMVKDLAKAATYVAKYVSKPMVATYASSVEAIAEALAALRHRRMVLLTGTWHAVSDEEPPD